MQVTLHHDNIDDLLPDWSRLFAADHAATPFQSPAWTQAWWRYWGERCHPWLLTVQDAGELVGLAALWRERKLGLRVLRVTGEPGDYWDLLAQPAYRAAVEESLTQELARRSHEWDVLVLSRLTPGSSLVNTSERAGLRPVYRRAVPCPGLELPESFDAYLATLPTKRRTELRRALRGITSGELRLEVPTADELPQAIEHWQALRARQWAAQRRRINPIHVESRFRHFLVEVLTVLVPAGLAVVWEFRRHDELVGSFVNFCNARTFYQYLGGFAPEWRHLSIGKLATAEGIRASIAAGRSYYDFARGHEHQKYWFGAVDQFSAGTVFTRPALSWTRKPRLGALAARLWG